MNFDYILSRAGEYLIPFLIGSSMGLIRPVIHWFSAKELHDDILYSHKIRTIIQELSEVRFMLDANRILITRIHNSIRWLNKSHMNKLSIFKIISLDDPERSYEFKAFDKLLNGMGISELEPLLYNTTNKNFDIIRVSDLPKDFIYRKELRFDDIKTVVTVKIMHKRNTLGYMFILFSSDKDVSYDKQNFKKIEHAALQIGELFK